MVFRVVCKKRAFAPIADINPSNMVNIIKNSVELEAKDDSYYLLEMIEVQIRNDKQQ